MSAVVGLDSSDLHKHFARILAVAAQPTGIEVVIKRLAGSSARCYKSLRRLLFLWDEAAATNGWVLNPKMPTARLLSVMCEAPAALSTIAKFLLEKRALHGASRIRMLVVNGSPMFKKLDQELSDYVDRILSS